MNPQNPDPNQQPAPQYAQPTGYPAAAPIPQPQPRLEVSFIPQEWPTDSTGSKLYPYSKALIKTCFWPFLFLTILCLIVEPNYSFREHGPTLIVGYLIVTLIFSLFSGARTAALLEAVDGKGFSISRGFKTAFNRYPKLLVANIMVNIIVLIGAIFLIIPGLYLYCRLYLTNLYIIDKNMGPIEAMKSSYRRTDNKEWYKVSQILVFQLLRALLMITIIGIPFAIYQLLHFGAAGPITYRFMDLHDPSGANYPVNNGGSIAYVNSTVAATYNPAQPQPVIAQPQMAQYQPVSYAPPQTQVPQQPVAQPINPTQQQNPLQSQMPSQNNPNQQ